MSAPVVVSVAAGSPAERAGLVPGDEVRRLNGQIPRDVIEWKLLADEADLDMEVARHGVDLDVHIGKGSGEPLGVEVSSAVFDRVRTCDNHCEFCFIYQLPKGMRKSLYLKDDDYRLSFLYGNFTTLTRFTEADLERVVTERLSPINVSIHATDPDRRARMLRNPRGAMSLRWLRALLDHGIDVRGQVVVCPGVNDGAVLDDTLGGVLDQYPELTSVAVVPLGLSRFNNESNMRLHTVDEAVAVVELVHAWQDVFAAVLGHPMTYLADEYYLMAGRPFPPAGHYGDFSMYEDGIGMARTFEREFAGETTDATSPRRGFFAAVDAPATDAPAPAADAQVRAAARSEALPPNPAAYTALRSDHACHPADRDFSSTVGAESQFPGTYANSWRKVALRASRRAPVGVLTGTLGARVIEPMVTSLGRDDVRVIPVANEFFGGNTGVTGLMVGEDVDRTLRGEPIGHRYLLPDVCLSDDGRFLDGVTVADLVRPVDVIATDGHALRAALEATA